MYYRNKKRCGRCVRWIVIVIAVLGVLGSVNGYLMTGQKEKQLDELRKQKELFEKELYVATRDLRVGQVLTLEDVVLQVRYTDTERSNYLDTEDIGKILLTDVREGECLTKRMITDTKTDVREVVVNRIDLPVGLTEGDLVDLRISYGNAEDYVVLAKKLLVYCEEKKGIILRLEEKEILFLSSALHDCESYKDTQLYLVKYPEYRNMQGSDVNYIPNVAVLSMLHQDTKIDKRKQLEQRLTER